MAIYFAGWNAVFTLVSVYAPNCRTVRIVIFLNVSRFLKEHETGILIVWGDFNEPLIPTAFYW